LFVTDPTGIYFEYKATAIGENDTAIKDMLEKEYKESMNINDGLGLAVRVLRKALGKEFDVSRLDGAYIRTSDKKFTKLKKEDFKGK
jgi:proteasome alpha subunit